MKSNEYLIVHKSLLPDYLDQVIAARELINEKNYTITESCKLQNISRTTYYKYKDYVYKFNKENINKVLLNINTIDEKGVLSSILKLISECNGNIITINQEHPVDSSAFISIAIDVIDLNITIDELKEKISMIHGVKAVNLSLL